MCGWGGWWCGRGWAEGGGRAVSVGHGECAVGQVVVGGRVQCTRWSQVCDVRAYENSAMAARKLESHKWERARLSGRQVVGMFVACTCSYW
jgi:hypothetical protein